MDARATEFGTADAKARFSELLARVEAGEAITIRRHGKIAAKMVPARRKPNRETRVKAVEEFLTWRKAHGPAMAARR